MGLVCHASQYAIFFLNLILLRSGTDQMGWYAYKGEIRRYLQQLNDKEKVGSDKPDTTLLLTFCLLLGPGIHPFPARPVPQLLDIPLQVDQTSSEY